MPRSLCAAIAIFSCALPISAAAQQSSFTVGTATAESGQKVTGTLDVPAGSDAATQIPVVVIRGSNAGPTLALVSGAHGTEYASIIALEGLISSLDPTQISGTVILLPLVNIASFQQKVPHVNPIDGKMYTVVGDETTGGWVYSTVNPILSTGGAQTFGAWILQ